jgi:hypothetical protein
MRKVIGAVLQLGSNLANSVHCPVSTCVLFNTGVRYCIKCEGAFPITSNDSNLANSVHCPVSTCVLFNMGVRYCIKCEGAFPITSNDDAVVDLVYK